jgi:hypothetical protein
VEEQNHRFKAYLIQEAAEDYMGVEGSEKRHGSLKTYVIKSFIERERQPTHHRESSVFNEAYKGDLSKLFDEAYKENVFKLAVMNNAVDVDVPGAVATNISINYGPEDPNTNCVEGTKGTESRRSGPRTTPRGST